MQQVLNIRNSDDPRDIIHLAVQALVDGELVVFPSETGYLITGYSLQKIAAERLKAVLNAHACDLETRGSCFLTLKSGTELADYTGVLEGFGRKLSRRCWPGPVSLSLPTQIDTGTVPTLLSSFSKPVRELLVNENRVQYRVPAHDSIQDAMKLLPAPLVTIRECWGKSALLTTAADVQEFLKDQSALVIDDGPSRYGQAATVVHVDESEWELREKGVVSAATLRRLASDMFLFVCTGNTCRSPMAEVLFRKYLADKLQCQDDELLERGFIVESAGLSALAGMRAAVEAVDVVAEQGVDLSVHQSQPLTNRLIDQADYIFVMTRGHLDSLLSVRPDIHDRVRLLSSDGSDVSDPIGAGRAQYEECKTQIEQYVRDIVDNIQLTDQ
ncbi:Low molecular weight protein-tyrosine-phosphatase YwlE [Polystyrenella longa]|uniref:protein-tyrosine-phosphatase n=1 Tax=Polystyrenella longa TaxID=2528007 RepID=A0A518CLV6_9PLAN|nr:Sua5/YciO/YrdC/YwlC family protein [Polystyrenella longa]QDU80183.1 Low molecular weight protein-tyrosine-phosphatase YwlE [Polystyrenella longa]